MELRATTMVQDTLEQAKEAGLEVSLHLRNGMTFSGKVDQVAKHQVVLSELAGKEFYDALILIEDISVIEARLR